MRGATKAVFVMLLAALAWALINPNIITRGFTETKGTRICAYGGPDYDDKLCVAGYAGPLAQEVQDLKISIRAKDALIKKLKVENKALKDRVTILSGKVKSLEDESGFAGQVAKEQSQRAERAETAFGWAIMVIVALAGALLAVSLICAMVIGFKNDKIRDLEGRR